MHPTPSFFRTVLAAVALALALPGSARPLGAQEPVPADSIAALLARLQARVDSLEALVQRLQAEGRDPEARDALAELRAAAQAAVQAGGARPDTADEQAFEGRQRSLPALNPEISLNADVLMHVDRDDTNADNFIPREFEFSFQAALDPFSRAKVYVSQHNPGGELIPFGDEDEHGHEGEGAGLSVEEGYVQWVSLPGGLGLTLGKFYQRFGTLNRWHAHALSFQSRSLPHLAFIGEEALAQTGAAVSWLLPVHGAGTYEAQLEVTRSENENLFGESGRLSLLGHLNAFWQLTPSTDFDLGLSWINGSFETEDAFFDQNLYGAEFAFTWRPPAQARYRALNLRGGVMIKDPAGGVAPHHEEEEEDHEEEEDGEPILGRTARGFWSQAELRLSPSWLVGARYDWVENPADPDETAWLISPTLTWWQSEWVRVRAEYDFIRRTVGPDTGKFILQVTFAMGPHKHETY
jgi:hypothetical protein